MKVALFVHCFYPRHFYGTEAYTLELARNLLAIGHKPVVVTATYPGEPSRCEVLSAYEYENIPVYCIDKNYFPHQRVKDTYFQPAIRPLLKDLLIDLKPDIVHVTHLINHTAVLLDVIRELKLPVVATLTDFFGFCFNNKLEAADGSLCSGPNEQRTNCIACFLKARSEQPGASCVERWVGRRQWSSMTASLLKRLATVQGIRSSRIAETVRDLTERPTLLRDLYSSYRAVIAPTKFLLNAYVRNGLAVPIHEIRFGVDLPRGLKPARPVDGPIKLGFIGQIAPHKGTDILVNAFCRLPRGKAELHIFGPDDQNPAYMADLKKNAIGCAVSFRGTFPANNMAGILSELDFVVIPSRWYENSPLILLYSLASHTPVIVSNVEGLTEFIEPGKNGFVFERGSISDLEQVLLRIIEDPTQSRTLNATTWYERTSQTMTADVCRIYKAILSENALPSV
jgi:glycosyltransferase involved in cell wall biosynthesis